MKLLRSAKIILLVAGGCAAPALPPTFGGSSPGAAADTLVGPRTVVVETRMVLAEDSSAREETVVRMSGDLASAASEALKEGDEQKRKDQLNGLAGLLLGQENVEITDAVRSPSGEVTFRIEQTWDLVAFQGALRILPAPVGTNAAVVAALAPVSAGALVALSRQEAGPKRPPLLPRARVERRYSLTLPDGFAARKLPGDLKLEERGVTVERRFRTVSKHQLEGTLRFEISGPDVALEALDRLYQQVQEKDRAPLPLEVEMAAETLASTGRLAEAIREIRRLLAAHPERYFYRARHAALLADVGLVDAARAEARRGVELAPNAAFAYQILAKTLEVDRFGRWFSAGFDRAGALAARRRQLALTGPTGRGAFELARLLSYDEHGTAFGAGTPLEEIATLTREVEHFRVDAAVLHVQVLLRLGRGKDAEPVIREHLPGEKHAGYLLAAVAQARGVDAALDELPALSLSGAAAAGTAMQAARELMYAGVYPVAAGLAAAAARLDPRSQQEADTVARLRPPEQRRSDERPAAETLRRLQHACLRPESFRKAAAALVHPRLLAGRRADDRHLFEQVCPMVLVRWPWPRTHQWMVDYDVTHDVAVAGDAAAGWRVGYQRPPAGARHAGVFYFAAAGPTALPQLLGRGPFVMGEEALRLATAGRAREAAVWLEWAREAVAVLGVPGRPSAAAGALEALWPPGAPQQLQQLREAGAAVAAYGDETTAKAAIAALTPALATTPDPARRVAIARPLLWALISTGGRPDLEHIASLLAADTDARTIWLRAQAHATAGDCPRALEIARPGKQSKLDIPTLRAHANVASHCGAFAEAVQALRKAVALPDAAPVEPNNLSWFLVASGQTGAESLGLARRAVQESGRQSRSLLQTLAVAAALAGNAAEARAVFVEALQRPAATDPLDEAAAWFAVGTIAEALGLPEEAVATYERVKPTPRTERNLASSWNLARKRLAALGNGGQKKR